MTRKRITQSKGDPYKAYERLKFRRPRPGVLEIVLASPGKLNAIDADMHSELAAVWRSVETDQSTRAVIVRGEGNVFSSGGDLNWIRHMTTSQRARVRAMRETRDIAYNMINLSKPIVSAVSGVAVGAGLAIAVLADISIVTPDARLIDGHMKLGLVAGDHAVMAWPILIGLAKAKRYLLTSEALSGREAERIGLVSMCVEESELMQRAQDVAESLAASPTYSIHWTKHTINNWLRNAGPYFDSSVALEFLGFTELEPKRRVSAALKRKRL
jgi:enoyl-CoA hydratase